MKRPVKIVAIVLVGLVGLGVAKDQVARVAVGAGASRVLGTRVEIGGLSLGLVSQSARVRHLRVWNPRGFPGGVMVDLPRIEVTCDLPAMLGGTLHLRRARVELRELTLVRNADGVLNVDALKVSQAKGNRPGRADGRQQLQIDELTLKIGRIISKDYRAGGEPAIQVFDLNIDKTYRNITNPEQLAVLILTEPMRQAGVKGAVIYGAAALTGVGLVPVVAATMLTGKDSAEQTFSVPPTRVFDQCRQVLARAGTVARQDPSERILVAEVRGAKVTVTIHATPSNASRVMVSARQFLLPKPEIARGILYQIEQALR